MKATTIILTLIAMLAGCATPSGTGTARVRKAAPKSRYRFLVGIRVRRTVMPD